MASFWISPTSPSDIFWHLTVLQMVFKCDERATHNERQALHCFTFSLELACKCNPLRGNPELYNTSSSCTNIQPTNELLDAMLCCERDPWYPCDTRVETSFIIHPEAVLPVRALGIRCRPGYAHVIASHRSRAAVWRCVARAGPLGGSVRWKEGGDES
jgi:hypothetical protein